LDKCFRAAQDIFGNATHYLHLQFRAPDESPEDTGNQVASFSSGIWNRYGETVFVNAGIDRYMYLGYFPIKLFAGSAGSIGNGNWFCATERRKYIVL
jgi:hypothetical protein